MLERLSDKFAGKLIRAGIISESDAGVCTFFSIGYDASEHCDNIALGHAVSASDSLHFAEPILHSHTNKCRRTSCRQPDEMLYKFNHYDCNLVDCNKMDSHSSCCFCCSAFFIGDYNRDSGTCGNGE